MNGRRLVGAAVLVSALVWSSLAGAANVVVSVNGARGCYTVQLFRNGVLYRTTTANNQLGSFNFTFTGVPDGSSYYAKTWWNADPTPSNTWPPKNNVTGTTHLGCLAFNMTGDPVPWSGACPPWCWNCSGSQASPCQ